LDHNNSQYWVMAVLNIRSRQFSIMDQDNSQYWIKMQYWVILIQYWELSWSIIENCLDLILRTAMTQYWELLLSNIDQNNYQYWVKNIYDIGSRQLSSLLFCLFSFFLLTIIILRIVLIQYWVILIQYWELSWSIIENCLDLILRTAMTQYCQY
jgi:diacylglycerol kinase